MGTGAVAWCPGVPAGLHSPSACELQAMSTWRWALLSICSEATPTLPSPPWTYVSRDSITQVCAAPVPSEALTPVTFLTTAMRSEAARRLKEDVAGSTARSLRPAQPSGFLWT